MYMHTQKFWYPPASAQALPCRSTGTRLTVVLSACLRKGEGGYPAFRVFFGQDRQTEEHCRE